ncbi:MAG: ABC transporter permease [Bacteroidetes bacterium]|nr:ABC transporter permease [Bacteroidota bacterium]
MNDRRLDMDGGWLQRNIPGLSFIARGQRTFGWLLLAYFLMFPVLILANLNSFIEGMRSMGLSVFLVLVDFDHHRLFLRIDVLEHWLSSILVIAMPVLLWWLNRRRLRGMARDSDEHELSQWALAWREFKKNRIAATGLVVIIILYTIAFLCPYFAPYHPNAFQDGLVTKFRKPLSSVTVLHLNEESVSSRNLASLRMQSDYPSLVRDLVLINRDLTDDGFASTRAVDAFRVEGAEVKATVGDDLVSIPISSLVSPDPEEFAGRRIHLMGTDSYGRDILSRIIYGSRISLTLGFVAVLLSVTFGTLIGLLAGYFGRFTDSVLMRFVDVLLAFPALFLILIIIAAFETIAVPRVVLIVLVLGLTSWMGISRLVRGEVLAVKEREFVFAARALGLGHARILRRHILPNILTPIIVNATLRIGGIILVEAALSYLNIGVQQPTASWGNIIFEGKDFLSHAWWISTLPGFAIVVVVVCFNLVGDGLRDAFDPMLNNERV